MINYIKKEFINHPEKIKEFLEIYGYTNIKINKNYIAFGRDKGSSPKSITLYLENNDALIVKDWAKNQSMDIINYIIKNKKVEFIEVINNAKNVLGIDNLYINSNKENRVFGNFYNDIRSKVNKEIKIYDPSIMDNYIACGNERFLKDNISLEAQRYFDIRFSVDDQSIVIPIHTPTGELMGLKARVNDDNIEGQKYYYLTDETNSGVNMSQTLYGYSQNYEYLESANEIVIFEAEKSVLQTFTFDERNTIGLGSSSLSKKQCQLILSLNPKRIILAHDKNSNIEIIKRNAKMLKIYGRMKEFDIFYTYLDNDDRIPSKSSPSDMGLKMYKEIMKTKLVEYVEEKQDE